MHSVPLSAVLADLDVFDHGPMTTPALVSDRTMFDGMGSFSEHVVPYLHLTNRYSHNKQEAEDCVIESVLTLPIGTYLGTCLLNKGALAWRT